MTFDFLPLLFITFDPHDWHLTFEWNEDVYERGVTEHYNPFEVTYKQWNKYEHKDFDTVFFITIIWGLVLFDEEL